MSHILALLHAPRSVQRKYDNTKFKIEYKAVLELLMGCTRCTWFGHGDDLDGDVDPVVAAAPGAVLRLESGDLDAVRIHTAAVLLPVEERII